MICRRFQTDAMYCLGLSGVIDLFSLVRDCAAVAMIASATARSVRYGRTASSPTMTGIRSCISAILSFACLVRITNQYLPSMILYKPQRYKTDDEPTLNRYFVLSELHS